MGEEKKIENKSRRKAVKTIIGGVTAIAAYHTMPTNWSKPLIEQVFLPAYGAACSGVTILPCSIVDDGYTAVGPSSYNWNFTLNVAVTPPCAGALVTLVRTVTRTNTGDTVIPLSHPSLVTDSNGEFTLSIGTESQDNDEVTQVSYSVSIEGALNTVSCTLIAPGNPAD